MQERERGQREHGEGGVGMITHHLFYYMGRTSSEGLLLLVANVKHAVLVLVLVVYHLHALLSVKKKLPMLGTVPATNK